MIFAPDGAYRMGSDRQILMIFRMTTKLQMTPPYAAIFVAFATIGMSSLAARSDQFPVLNVKPLCHGITEQSSLQEGFQTVTFDQCMQAEQEDRESMIKEWSTFSSNDKKHCIAEATMGGESSYTDLLTCLEMARDVRKLKSPGESN